MLNLVEHCQKILLTWGELMELIQKEKKWKGLSVVIVLGMKLDIATTTNFQSPNKEKVHK